MMIDDPKKQAELSDFVTKEFSSHIKLSAHTFAVFAKGTNKPIDLEKILYIHAHSLLCGLLDLNRLIVKSNEGR